MDATVFPDELKASFKAAPGFRSVLFTLTSS
jgi:hypothetical protein